VFTSRLISLVIIAVYLVVFIVFYLVGEFEAQEVAVKSFVGLLAWTGLSLACIWYGDEMGDGLVGARFGLISSPSPGWAVKLIGWVLLLMPIIVAVIIWVLTK
jgi:hypothetical protein